MKTDIVISIIVILLLSFKFGRDVSIVNLLFGVNPRYSLEY